jgi:hypothetical protein
MCRLSPPTAKPSSGRPRIVNRNQRPGSVDAMGASCATEPARRPSPSRSLPESRATPIEEISNAAPAYW